MWKSGEVDGTLEGFTIDLLNELAQDLSFKYKIYTSPDNAYGSQKDGNWNGMIEQVRKGVNVLLLTDSHCWLQSINLNTVAPRTSEAPGMQGKLR